MTCIIISSDDPETARQIGNRAAEALGLRYVGRSLLQDVAARHDVPEEKLAEALDAFSTSRWSKKSRTLLLSYVETATLEQLQQDGIVCAELGAHLFARGVPHLLLVRVIGDIDAQVRRLVEERKLSPAKAKKILDKERARRSSWSLDNFGFDENAVEIYDLAIRVNQIGVDKMVEVLVDMANYRKFKAMTYSRKLLADLELASRVRLALFGRCPDMRVRANGETVIVHVKCPQRKKLKTAEEIKAIASELAGVKLVEVHTVQRRRDLDQLD